MKHGKAGDWVRIHKVVLKAGERTARLPEDTKNCDLYNYLSNFPYFIGFPACPLVK